MATYYLIWPTASVNYFSKSQYSPTLSQQLFAAKSYLSYVVFHSTCATAIPFYPDLEEQQQ